MQQTKEIRETEKNNTYTFPISTNKELQGKGKQQSNFELGMCMRLLT